MNEASGDHYEILLRGAAHRLADTLAPYRVLTGERLAEFSEASCWSVIDFKAALRWAVDHRLLSRLDEDLYEIGPEAY